MHDFSPVIAMPRLTIALTLLVALALLAAWGLRGEPEPVPDVVRGAPAAFPRREPMERPLLKPTQPDLPYCDPGVPEPCVPGGDPGGS